MSMPLLAQAQKKASVVVKTQNVAPLPLKTQAKLRSNESDVFASDTQKNTINN